MRKRVQSSKVLIRESKLRIYLRILNQQRVLNQREFEFFLLQEVSQKLQLNYHQERRQNYLSFSIQRSQVSRYKASQECDFESRVVRIKVLKRDKILNSVASLFSHPLFLYLLKSTQIKQVRSYIVLQFEKQTQVLYLSCSILRQIQTLRVPYIFQSQKLEIKVSRTVPNSETKSISYLDLTKNSVPQVIINSDSHPPQSQFPEVLTERADQNDFWRDGIKGFDSSHGFQVTKPVNTSHQCSESVQKELILPKESLDQYDLKQNQSKLKSLSKLQCKVDTFSSTQSSSQDRILSNFATKSNSPDLDQIEKISEKVFFNFKDSSLSKLSKKYQGKVSLASSDHKSRRGEAKPQIHSILNFEKPVSYEDGYQIKFESGFKEPQMIRGKKRKSKLLKSHSKTQQLDECYNVMQDTANYSNFFQQQEERFSTKYNFCKKTQWASPTKNSQYESSLVQNHNEVYFEDYFTSEVRAVNRLCFYQDLETQEYDIDNFEDDFEQAPSAKLQQKSQAPKETYEVVIPRSCKELGIKARNYTNQEISQFTVNFSKIFSDGRTSLMIKNIPNKYYKQLLIDTIEVSHKNKYDFLYLPIDFQNKCNVGYAFINLKSLDHVKSFYQRFQGRGWEYFNSDKICEITYARLQGFNALRSHFQTSSIRIQKDSKLKPEIKPSLKGEKKSHQALTSSSSVIKKSIIQKKK